MCKAEPGPRCSFHAHKEYTATISALAKASTEAEKVRLEGKLSEKEEIYYTTPRGQNFLRRKLMFAETEEERALYEQKLNRGVETREAQLAAYRALHDRATNENLAIRENSSLSLRTKKAGIVLKRCIQWLRIDTATIGANSDTLETPAGSFLIVGGKHTARIPNPSDMRGLPQLGVWVDADPELSALVMSHYFGELKKSGFRGVSLINYISDDVCFLTFDDAEKAFQVRVKQTEKKGGTNKWVRSSQEAAGQLREAGFPEMKFSSHPQHGLIATSEEMIPAAMNTAGNVYLSRQEADNGESFYIVRRRSSSSQVLLTLELRPRKKTFGSYVSEDFRPSNSSKPV